MYGGVAVVMNGSKGLEIGGTDTNREKESMGDETGRGRGRELKDTVE